MAYLALYRQWRPKKFSDFVGQEAVITALKNQVISGRIGHAYLFCGSRGTGKTSAAKVFALAINCKDPQAGEACGVCDSCRALSLENTMDIVEIDAASNNGVDEIRDLREKVAYPPQEGKYRVYIIDEVHMLSTGAFNALLKTLEEPPGHAVFILATTEPQKLPATILSRCQRYDFRRIPLHQLVERLREAAVGAGVTATPQALERIGRAAEGGMRDALSILDMCLSLTEGELTEDVVLDVLGASDRSFLFGYAQALIDGNPAGALSAIAELITLGREVSVFARDILQHLRQLMLAQTCREGLADLLELTGEDAQRLIDQGAQVSRERLLYMMNLFLTADTDLKWSSQPRIALEMASVQACLPPAGEDAQALLLRIQALEEKVEKGVPLAAPATQPEKKAAKKSAAPVSPSPSEETLPSAAEAPSMEASAPVSTPAAKGPKETWKAFTDALKREAPALYSMVLQGEFLGREENAFLLRFAKQGEIYLSMLQKPEKLELLEQSLSSCAGEKVSLRLSLESASAATPADPNESLQKAFSLFGRENVQVLREDE